MNKAQLHLMEIGLKDKYAGEVKKTKEGGVIVDPSGIYVSDLMVYWAELENKELKEDIIDCLEELTENNTITPKVAEYFDYMRERYLGKWSTE